MYIHSFIHFILSIKVCESDLPFQGQMERILFLCLALHINKNYKNLRYRWHTARRLPRRGLSPWHSNWKNY